MKFILSLLLMIVTAVAVLGQTETQDEIAAEQTVDEVILAVDEKEVNEVIQDMREDEAKVVAAPEEDEKKVRDAEADVKRDAEIVEVKMVDIQEMLEDIQDDQVDRDADIIERKLDDIKFAKDQNGKSDAERRKAELANKKKRNEERKQKRKERAEKHADRHKQADKWTEIMKKDHPNKVA